MADPTVVATIAIPTVAGEPYYTQRTRLDGRDYNLHFAWNEREERWRLSIHDDEDVPLVRGLKLVANWPLLRFYRFDPRVPPGELMVVDLTGSNEPPGLDDLGIGRRCELVYYATTT
jgi:hypothetical protein